jgi:hypothetical protein
MTDFCRFSQKKTGQALNTGFIVRLSDATKPSLLSAVLLLARSGILSILFIRCTIVCFILTVYFFYLDNSATKNKQQVNEMVSIFPQARLSLLLFLHHSILLLYLQLRCRQQEKYLLIEGKTLNRYQ